MKDALVALALALCPWAEGPLPPIHVLPPGVYEVAALRRGLPPASRGFTVWLRHFRGAAVVYLSMRADERTLCHELAHARGVHPHLLTPPASPR